MIEHDEMLLDKVLQKFKDIDECEFAMFSLCLVEEIIEEVKNDCRGKERAV